MTATLSAAAIRMPLQASVAAPAPLARRASAEPCAPISGMQRGLEISGIIAPAFAWAGDTDGSARFGGAALINGGGSAWYRHDQAQLAGGGPLRG